MRYIWDRTQPTDIRRKRVMHIAQYTVSGEMLFKALCGIRHNFNTSGNAPFGLGQKICKNCRKVLRMEGRDEILY